MNKFKLIIQLAFCAILLFGCSDDAIVIEQEHMKEKAQVDKEKMAFQLIDLLNSPDFKTQIITTLNDQIQGVKLRSLLSEVSTSIKDKPAYQALLYTTINADQRLEKELYPDQIEIPEVWMKQPLNTTDYSELLVSFAPKGDEKNWEFIKAYTLTKEVVYLDVMEDPNRPVIVIETDGFETLKKEVEYMNNKLQIEGLQNSRFSDRKMDLSPASKINNGIETTKIDKIRLNNDEEPWISGAAEVYAITSGIRNSDNEAEIKIIPMYYLDYSGTDYYPNQIILFWDDYAYQAANIQLFEKDDNHNYKNLVAVIVDGVFQIVGTQTAQPWVNVLGQVANAIIQAMPDEWYTNTDDYIDSFYTILKNQTYSDYYGAGHNARVSMSPLFIPEN